MILDEIAAYKRIEVNERKRTNGYIDTSLTPIVRRDFASALKRNGGIVPKIIAEVKKASPSKGIIRSDFDPVTIAKDYYESNGAAAISVLTDEKFFQGHLDYLRECRAAIGIPALRKDFIIDEYQIDEAAAVRADAILLIAALLDTDTLRAYRQIAESFGMASLVEVHDEKELESAIDSGADIVGINNRNLQTFVVDIETTFRLAKLIPDGKTIVSESGIQTRDDLVRLADAGIDAALIGESLMREVDPGAKLRELIG